MSKNLYTIDKFDNGVKIRLDGKTAVYMRNLPKAKPVCWDKAGSAFDIIIQKFMESYIITPVGEITYPAYIDIREEQENNLMYIA